jgi:ApaG protein
MERRTDHAFDIDVTARYLEEQSEPGQARYAFAYTIRIRNRGTVAAQLISRHWVITDAQGQVREVRGEGVVGEQPWLRPDEQFQYSSGAVLEAVPGTMEGSYTMLADDGTTFEAPIPAFTLALPRTLH